MPRVAQPLALLPAALVAGVAALAGTAVVLGPATLVVNTVGLAALAIAAPLALVGVSIGEQWPLVASAPAGAGEAIVAVAIAGAAGYGLRYPPCRICDLSRFAPVHVALLAVLALSLLNSYQNAGADSDLVVLVTLGAVPLGFVGATLKCESVPISWLAITAALPVALAVGFESPHAVSIIGVGNVSWAAVYFAVVLRHRLPRIVTAVVIAVAATQLALNEPYGPKVAAGVVAILYARQQSSSRVRPLRAPSRRLARVLAAAGVLAAIVALGGALTELQSDQFNNTTVRAAAWKQTVRDATLTGRGIVSTAGDIAGRSFEIPSHNFVLDALSGAGWIGLALITVVAGSVLAAVWRSTHPLVPYCAGVLVANSVSGGLFRSLSLWFAMAFLISEARATRSSSPTYETRTIMSARPRQALAASRGSAE